MAFQQDPLLWEESGQARYAALLREAEEYRSAVRAQRSSESALQRLTALWRQLIGTTAPQQKQPRATELCGSAPSTGTNF
jgi:hypothetical protein